MNSNLEKLKIRINKITEQQHQIEDKYISVISTLVKDLTGKGIDLSILAGMLLNANTIIQDSSFKTEAWQEAGEKFLFKSKIKHKKARQVNSKNQTS